MKKLEVFGASFFVVSILLIYSFSTAMSADFTEIGNANFGELEVVKEVYFEGEWTEGPIETILGEILNFRITLTYHNTSGIPKTHWANHIKVNDSLPDCLDYNAGTADPSENFNWLHNGNEYLLWDFGEQMLYDQDSLIIKYNATVVEPTGPTPQENNVTVLWDEYCTQGYNLESTDFLLITVSSEPKINLVKTVWNPHTHQYEKSIVTYEGETLHFRINVYNNGPTDLTEVVVKDVYPEFITPFEYSIPPDSVDTTNRIITWNIGTIPAQDSVVILFNATVNLAQQSTTGKNYANVTCEQELFDEDNVTIIIEKHFTLIKKVKHPETGEWVDEIPYVKGCEPIRFRINITYYGIERMKCLLVYDQLPIDCLNYSDNVYIEIAGQEITPADTDYYPDIFTEGDLFIKCSNPIEVPEGGIYFSWINQSIAGGLESGENVIIEFDANVINYCEAVDQEVCIKENCAEAWLWSCCDFMYYAKDCVNITCIALPGEFNKTASLETPTNWVKELHTVQGNTIKFKLELTYYGNENLTKVSFKDVLPCCLEYIDTIEMPAGTVINVSTDKKTIWWNVSKEVSDCETVTIIFRADVVGSSACGGCINYAYVYGYIQELCSDPILVVEKMDSASIIAEPNSSPCAPDVSGPSEGLIGVEYTFRAMLEDLDEDQLTYMFNWGDTTTGWLGPVSSGEVIEQHTYNSAGTYLIKVKAKDEHGAESGWTEYPWSIQIKSAKVDISLKMFHFGSIEAEVTNAGDADLNNLQWKFNISRDSLLGLRDINIDGNGTISSLTSGSTTAIASDELSSKFGLADLTVTVIKSGVIEPATETVQVLLIGPIALVLAV